MAGRSMSFPFFRFLIYVYFNEAFVKNVMKKLEKCGGKTITRPFSKKSKLSIFLDQCAKVLYSLFL